ncbi:MAG: stage III sporulation protein AA [Candidatus Marinamargulisbacteria bacterium]|jgi:stage III sporulation protein AA
MSKTPDIDSLLAKFPKPFQAYLKAHSPKGMTEIVLDLGGYPEIRYENRTMKLKELGEVTQRDIDDVVKNVGIFNTDNRAGIERTLHRISAIRNRSGEIIGLTCRVGREVRGTIDIIRDMIQSGHNVLFMGPPGIGKTTLLREAARVLSDEWSKRVMIVDTSNEIAGDGDIPHPGIGGARRMQVPSPDRQHAVMIEAVENHMPEAIIIDEIGTEEETRAVRTIAERGVQLVATAHGYTLENLIKNPTLADLTGGIQSVILGDEEAKMRGTQKTVLERKTYPTFDVLVEMRSRDVVAVYEPLSDYVDAYLRDESCEPEIRQRGTDEPEADALTIEHVTARPGKRVSREKKDKNTTSIFCFGVQSERFRTAIAALGVDAKLVQSVHDADMVVTIRSNMRSKAKIKNLMEGLTIPLHVIQRNDSKQIAKLLRNLFNLTDTGDDLESESIREIRRICKRVMDEKRVTDASPKSAFYRRIQHEVVDKLGLNAVSVGEEPNRRVRVYPIREGNSYD